MAPRHAGEDEQREGDHREHDRRVQVGFEHHERADATEHDHHRSPCAWIVQMRRPPCEDIRGVDQQRDLGELTRLQTHRSVAEPAPRAVDGDPDAGHEHDEEQTEGRNERDGRELPPEVIVDA